MALIGWATHVLQWYLQKVTKMKIGVNLIKITLVRIVGCNSPYMKAESLVIVDQHATVNLYLGLVLPARHTLEVRQVRRSTNPGRPLVQMPLNQR